MTEEIPAQKGQGSQPRSPLDLKSRSWQQALRSSAEEFKADRGGLISAGMAYYWFLAVFPALLAAVGLFGLFNISQAGIDSVTRAIRSALPGDAARVLTDAVSKSGEQSGGASLVATLVGLALAVWSASAGMVAMQAGLDVAYDVDEERKFVKKRLVALALLVATLVLGGLATAFTVFGAPIGESLEDNLPLGGAFELVWTIARWVLGLVTLSLLFATFYYLAPNRETPRWAWVSPGGLLATAIWLLGSLAFSFYVSSFGSYAQTYGSLAGVVVLLLWLYLSALAVIVGGEVNAELERQGHKEAQTGPVDRRAGGTDAPQLDAPTKVKDTSAPRDDAPPTAASGNGASGDEWTQAMRQLRTRR